MSVDLHRPPVQRRCTGPGGNTRTTPPPISRTNFVDALFTMYSPRVLSRHRLYDVPHSHVYQTREEYSMAADRQFKNPLAAGRGAAVAGAGAEAKVLLEELGS
jgi:hypothetical protein